MAGAVVGTIATVAFLGFMALSWAANLSSCVRTEGSNASKTPVPRPLDLSVPTEARLAEHLVALAKSSESASGSLDVWMFNDSAVNAASFGRGRFVLFAGLQGITDEQLDAILAHELGHDMLQHSKKSAEVKEVTDFVGETIGVIGGHDDATTKTLKRWSGSFIVPRYNRGQELEADAAAVGILTKHGYADAAAVVCDAFSQLRQKVGDGGGGFFDSHPSLTDRMNALRARFPSSRAQASCR
jgi:putative metalloprotease